MSSLLLMVLACGTFEAGLEGTPIPPADPAASAIAVLEQQRALLSTQAAALEARATPSIPPPQPQPTPQDVLGGGTIANGPFTFDLRLIRDASFSRQPVTTSLYSDLETIGAWTYWFYTGEAAIGPVQTWYGTVPQVEALLQAAYPSVQPGSSGGRSGGVLLPGGAYMAGSSQPGDRVQLVLRVTTAGAEYGAMLSFTLQQGPNGLEPSNITVEPLSVPGAPTALP
jgi:hypothetical protein